MQNRVLIGVMFACALITQTPYASGVSAASVVLERVWQLDGLASPESVALAASGDFLYVSNVNGEGDAVDGNGFISRVSLDGQMLEKMWAAGLDGPKGLVLQGDRLFVSDITQVVEISTGDGSVQSRTEAPGSGFLNDLAVLADGTVLASDSATARIYAVRNGKAEIWLEGELLKSINGLLPETQRLVVTTMAGRLLAVDYADRAVTVLAEGLGDADGIAPLGDGRYLVSEWPGLMHVVNAEGGHETIMDSRDDEVYLNDFLLLGDILIQPHWQPGRLSAYRIRAKEMRSDKYLGSE